MDSGTGVGLYVWYIPRFVQPPPTDQADLRRSKPRRVVPSLGSEASCSDTAALAAARCSCVAIILSFINDTNSVQYSYLCFSFLYDVAAVSVNNSDSNERTSSSVMFARMRQPSSLAKNTSMLLVQRPAL